MHPWLEHVSFTLRWGDAFPCFLSERARGEAGRSHLCHHVSPTPSGNQSKRCRLLVLVRNRALSHSAFSCWNQFCFNWFERRKEALAAIFQGLPRMCSTPSTHQSQLLFTPMPPADAPVSSTSLAFASPAVRIKCATVAAMLPWPEKRKPQMSGLARTVSYL